MNTTSQDRITGVSTTPGEMIIALCGDNPGAMSVLAQWLESSGLMGVIEMFTLDTKRLYDHRIWELYKDVCGEDIERFRYHVLTELPNQETGKLSVTGPYSPGFGNEEFWEKRRFGTPNSFWALEHPPTEPDYEYPIK